MKKILFLFALLASMIASATVTVTPLGVDYSTQKVTFSVSWTNSPAAPYNNRVWIWVDFCPVSGTSPGIFAKAVISGATATSGNVTDLNGRGFYVTANPTTVTATLTNAPAGKFNWCAYGSDAPPKMLSNNNGTLTLGGTPPFVLSDASGVNTYAVPGKTVSVQSVIGAGVVPVYISDETGCKGLLGFGNPVLQGNCTFTQPPVVNIFSAFPSTYSASTFVSLMDERDLKIYTAVKIGGRWWMGQNLNYQTGLTYWNKHSSPSTVTGSNPALRGGFWCPSNTANVTPVSVCDYWGALYAWETAMMLDGKGTWTEVSTYCTGAANSTACKTNLGRSASSGTAIGGRGICPPNWHVPTDFEWGQLLDAMESGLGTAHQTASGDKVWVGNDAGTRGKASCSGTSDDTNPVWRRGAGTDVFGLRILPYDNRNVDGHSDIGRGQYGAHWTSTAYNESEARVRDFSYESDGVYHTYGFRANGIGVRCVRD
jgi:uncharacterized protein (TIGR02145 family)